MSSCLFLIIKNMKKRSLVFRLAVVLPLFFFVFLISCGKDGATGPSGPEGPAGPAGPGGENGSGSVIYSEWLDLAYNADTIHTAGGGIDTIGYYATIDAPKLSLEMLNTADVKVYINVNDTTDPTIYSLPYYSPFSGISIMATAYTQKIDLYSNADVGTVLGNDGRKYQQYRYMIVPGNVPATSNASVNWSDYKAVKSYLGLKD